MCSCRRALSDVSGKVPEMGMERQMRSQGVSTRLEKARGWFCMWTFHRALKDVLPWARRTTGRGGSSWPTSLAGLQPKACWEEQSEHKELPLITRGNCRGILCFTEPLLRGGCELYNLDFVCQASAEALDSHQNCLIESKPAGKGYFACFWILIADYFVLLPGASKASGFSREKDLWETCCICFLCNILYGDGGL